MTKDVNKEFDSLMRSMLQDAEVKAPSGAWKAVSSRLEEKPAFRWGWVAAPLAFASLVLGVILFRVNDETPDFSTERLALVSEPVSVYTAAPEDIVLRNFPAFAGTVSERVSSNEGYSNAVESEDVSPEEPKAKPVISSPKQSSEPSVDPFAEMAREDAAAKRKARLSIDFGGTVSGSENKRSLIATRTSGVAATSLQDNIVETSTSTFGIPFTIGIGARLNFAKRFSVGTGVDFSLLTRTFTGQYTPAGGTMTEGDITHTMIYLGIPVDFHFDILYSQSVKFYAFAGGEIEFAVSNRYNIRSLDKTLGENVSKPQFSIGGGIGVEFKIGPRLGLYLDPGVNYYFNTDQPKSVRTERPLMFNLDGGLRFNF